MTSSLAGLPIQKAGEKAYTLNMLIYGESGVGKTRLAGSADEIPEMRKVLVVDVEGGTLSLRDLFPNVDTVRVTSWEDMQSVYDELFRGSHPYKTIIIDSLTEIQKISMDKVMRNLIEKDADRDPDFPGMREWGINVEQTRKFVRGFRDLPVNTIFTALMQSDKDQRSGAIKFKPSLSGKVRDEVAGFLDIVLYMFAKEIDGQNQRVVLSKQIEKAVAKDRTNLLPETIINPNMSDIWKYVSQTKEPSL